MNVRYLNEEKILERAEDESEALVHVGEILWNFFRRNLIYSRKKLI